MTFENHDPLSSAGPGDIDELEELERRFAQVSQQLSDSDCRCPATQQAVRRRTFANGSHHHVLQCRHCGEQRGSPLRAKDAEARLEGMTAQEFDPVIAQTYAEYRRVIVTEFKELQTLVTERRGGWAALIAADRAEERAKLERVRALVAQCAADVAAEIGEQKTADVLAAQAIALRRKLRDALFDATPRFTSEAELKVWLAAHLSEDFDLSPEVAGRHVAEGVRVIIDYLAYPKQHLLENGFAPAHFGIEVKYLGQADGFSHKAARGLWQTVSYTDSEFFLDGVTIRPKFALLFSNISFESEHQLLNRLGMELENDRALWNGLLQLANHANVGTLEVKGPREDWKGWKMAFSGGMYFYRNHYMGKREYGLSNPRMIEKVRVGNF
ncbi:hypothetical protein J7E49_21820 [Variovorax paradoxus]|nr:hypothetical protein [Variovorax paradoxus]